jgi:predicted metal-dependent hydrolase
MVWRDYRRKEVIFVAISAVSSQSSSAASLQNQEQQLLSQIKNLQSKDPQGNAAQIKILQQKYKRLVQQQQKAQGVTSQPQQNVKSADTMSKTQTPEASSVPSAPSAPSAPSSPTTASGGIDIKA